MTDQQTDQQAPVFTPEHPEFPKLVYNHEKRTTKAVVDKEDEDKQAGEGFVEDPFGPADPDSMTPEEVEQLQGLLGKAATALAKFGQLQQAA
jgi:hypothetical protein